MPNVLEFSILFPAPPPVFIGMVSILAVLVVYWVAKWVISIYTGAGGG